MGVCLENIFYPDEAIDEVQRLLYDIYLEDYGEENGKLIRQRQAKTVCLFDSDPIVTMQFLSDYNELFNDPKIEDRTAEEYRDFINLQRKKLPEIQKNYYDLLCDIFKLKDKGQFKEVLNLDYDSYSSDYDNLLNNPYCSNELKARILLRRAKYIEACNKIGVRNLVNKKEIAALRQARNLYYYNEFHFYLDESKWGKRIINNFYSKGIKINIDSLTAIMSGTNNACCAPFHLLRDKKGGSLIYFPIIQNRCFDGFDRIFYHENRHAIEYGKNYSGLSLTNPEKYVLCNEIRTEINALRDSKRMERYVLFSNDPIADGFFVRYERCFPYTGDFFYDNLDVINRLALRGDFDGFYEMFGYSFLRVMDTFLERIPESIIKSGKFDLSCISKGTEIVKQYVKK